MEKGEKLYEGKAKILYLTEDPEKLIQYFKDDATAFNGKKKGIIKDKGVVNAKLSEKLFKLLETNKIATHFIEMLSDREMLVKKLDIVPIEVVVRNIAAGSLAKRLGIEEGTPMEQPVVEHYFKSDELGDPLINRYHIRAMNLTTPSRLEMLESLSLDICGVLQGFLKEKGILLVDFKLEFGEHKGQLLLGDEISPDTCRFWDAKTKEKMDKDRFRRDLGKVEETYQEVLRRVVG